MAAICHWSIFKFSPNPIAKCKPRCLARRARAPARKPQVFQVFQILWISWVPWGSRVPLGSENSRFFKWVFTRTAVSVVSGRESGFWTGGWSWQRSLLCRRMPGSVSETTIPHCRFGNFSTIPTNNILNLADCSYLLSDDAYRLSLSLLCYRLSTPSYECKPNVQHFFAKPFIKTCCCWETKCVCLVKCHLGRLELMLYRTSSNICDFLSPLDFGLNVLFPHIFWFLHQNSVGISGFTLTKLRNVGDEDKTILSSLDTKSSMIAQPVLPQSANKNRLSEVRSFQYLVLDTF